MGDKTLAVLWSFTLLMLATSVYSKTQEMKKLETRVQSLELEQERHLRNHIQLEKSDG